MFLSNQPEIVFHLYIHDLRISLVSEESVITLSGVLSLSCPLRQHKRLCMYPRTEREQKVKPSCYYCLLTVVGRVGDRTLDLPHAKRALYH